MQKISVADTKTLAADLANFGKIRADSCAAEGNTCACMYALKFAVQTGINDFVFNEAAEKGILQHVTGKEKVDDLTPEEVKRVLAKAALYGFYCSAVLMQEKDAQGKYIRISETE